MRLLVQLRARFAEAAHRLALKFGACVFLGPLMSTRSFDHRVGKGRGRRGDSHAVGSHFPREPTVTALLGLQVQGWEDNSARPTAWEQGERAAPGALGKAATAAWVTRRGAASRKPATGLQREGC